MKIKLLEPRFTICKLKDVRAVDWNAPFCFAAKTDEEFSLVCPEAYVPAGTNEREDGWRAVRIEEILDFSLVGILSAITSALAQRKIPVFAVSTFQTDYLLVKEACLPDAIKALEQEGYELQA